MKPDEKALLIELARMKRAAKTLDAGCLHELADEVGERLGIHWKRVNYILEKWTNKHW